MTEDHQLVAIRKSLEADRAGLRAAVDSVPAGLRSRKPAADRWSVADVLEHLSIVESRVVGLLKAAIPAAPLGPSAGGVTPVDRHRLRDRTTKITSPESIRPSGTMNADEAWASLERTRQQLLSILDQAEGRDLTHISRQHPVLGQLDGYQWIAAIGGHEERHAAQIREIAASLALMRSA